MSDISLKLRAEALGKSLEKLAPQVEEELNQAVKNLAHAAHSAMISQIQSLKMDEQNRADYLKGLKIEDLGNDSYLIYLDSEWANSLESGYGAYSIRERLLNSNKIVQVGRRAGQPWVREGKDKQKYAAVPFQHRPQAGGKGGDLGTQLRQLMGEDLKGKKQAITKIFKNVDGQAISGQVATVKSVPKEMNQNLVGLTKYQSVSAKGKVSSVYLTYRMVSEKGKDWVHPGHRGYQMFKKAQEFVAKEMDNIILTVLK